MTAKKKLGLVLMAALVSGATLLAEGQNGGSSGQTATSQQQPAPQPKPKKKPEEPIDPDATAGVRGSGSMHTVRVFHKGKPVQGAHVTVKNLDGSLAASCYTNASGECQVNLGADSYIFNATKKERGGTVSQPVTDASGPIVMKLHKAKADDSAPKP